MLKRTVTTLLAFALLMGSFAFRSGAVHAQSDNTAVPGVWKTSVLIRNTSEIAAASVRVEFYNKDGSLVLTYPPAASAALNVNANGSVNVFVPDVSGLSGGQYSAVVSSNQKVIASVQISSVAEASGPWTAFAYEGVDSTSTATKLFFPAEMKNFYGFFSEMVIQNTSSSTATNLTVDFYSATGTKLNATPISMGTLAKSSAKTFATSDALFASLPSGSSGLFGAVVTSSATDIAGISNVWRTTPTYMTASYNAFTAGSRTLYAPNLMNSLYGFGSALSIQNVDQTDTAAGKVTYSNGTVETFSLPPNAAKTFGQFNRTDITLPSGNQNGSFSAKVEVTSTGGSIVGVVGFSRPPELNGGGIKGDYAYYNCPSVAATSVSIPSVMSNFYGFFTTISVQNTGNTSTYITLTYTDDGSGVKKWTSTDMVLPNGVVNFTHLAKDPKNPFGTTRTLTSAVASSSANQPLVALIQHNTDASVLGYTGKLPSDYLHVFSGTPKP